MAGKELVPAGQYAALTQDTDKLMATIKANLGGQKLNEFSLDRVKIPAGGGKAWSVPTLEGDEAMSAIEGIVVYWKATRAFWKQSYESQGGAPPDCSSPDSEYATGDPGIQVPRTPNGLLICESCANAQFGSDPREESNAQACKLVWQLFLLTPGDLLPIVVSLPPTSVGEASKYFLRLTRAGLPYHAVVTRLGLEQTQSGGGIKYSKATFEVGERLDDATATKIAAYADQMAPTFEANVAVEREEAGA